MDVTLCNPHFLFRMKVALTYSICYFGGFFIGENFGPLLSALDFLTFCAIKPFHGLLSFRIVCIYYLVNCNFLCLRFNAPRLAESLRFFHARKDSIQFVQQYGKSENPGLGNALNLHCVQCNPGVN